MKRYIFAVILPLLAVGPVAAHGLRMPGAFLGIVPAGLTSAALAAGGLVVGSRFLGTPDWLLTSAASVFAEKCIDGIRANEEGTSRSAEMTLAAATALNPYIGYDKGAEIVKEAAKSGRPLREVALEMGVDADTYDKAMDLRKMAQGNL